MQINFNKATKLVKPTKNKNKKMSDNNNKTNKPKGSMLKKAKQTLVGVVGIIILAVGFTNGGSIGNNIKAFGMNKAERQAIIAEQKEQVGAELTSVEQSISDSEKSISEIEQSIRELENSLAQQLSNVEAETITLEELKSKMTTLENGNPLPTKDK